MESGGKLFERFWSQALLTVSAAEDEATKVLSKVGLSPDEVRRHAREFGERLTSQRKTVENSVDDALKRSLTLPSQKDLQALHARVDAISQRIEALTK